MNNLSYKQIRTLNQTLQHSFSILLKNSVQVLICFLVFLLPIFVIINLISITAFNTDINLLLRLKVSYLTGNKKFIQLIISGAMLLVLCCIYNIILNKLILFKHQTTFKGNLFQFVKDGFIESFQKHYSNTLYAVLLFCATYLITDYIGYYIGGDNATDYQTDVTLFIFERLTAMIFSIVLMPIATYLLFASLFVSFRDNINVFLAFGKIKKHLIGNWPKIFGASLLFAFIYKLTGLIGILPSFIIGFFNLISWQDVSFVNLLWNIIKYYELIIKCFCIMLFAILCIYNYTSLEEKIEASEIKEKINSI